MLDVGPVSHAAVDDDACAAAALEVGGKHFADAAGVAAGEGLDDEHVAVLDGLEDGPKGAALFGALLRRAGKDIFALGHEGQRYGRTHNFGAGCARQGALNESVANAEAVHDGAGGGGAHLTELLNQLRMRAGDGAAVDGQGHAC